MSALLDVVDQALELCLEHSLGARNDATSVAALNLSSTLHVFQALESVYIASFG